MKNWMQHLANQYETMRDKYPDDKLIILFDIDGTVLDMRYTVQYLLKSYDQQFGTSYFRHLHLSHVTFHEDDICDGLKPFCIPANEIEKICQWYRENRWSMWSLFEANRPFPGVMEVMRWFQLQDKTHVGINTGRSEVFREDTLLSLNSLGREYRVIFDDHLLKMNRPGVHQDIAAGKIQAISEFMEMGYRVIAMVDNEPGNLDRIAESGVNDEILLLHASTIFKGQKEHRQVKAIAGNVYDLTGLIPKRALPQRIQFVWNYVNNDTSLMHFMNSGVMWADITGVARDLYGSTVNAEDHPESSDIIRYIRLFRENNKGIRINFELMADQSDLIIDLLARHDVESKHLWVSGKIDVLKKETYGLVADIFPEAIIECPVDFLVPIILTTPDQAEHILDTYTCWGINRFSLSWKTANIKKALGILDKMGFDVTIHDVNNLEEFLQAVLLLPAAIVSGFNFPMWESRPDSQSSGGLSLLRHA